MPYVGDTVAVRLTLLEARAAALEMKAGYFVGQGMVRIGDVGGPGTSTYTLTVSGIITGATKTHLNSGTSMYVTLNWADPGFDVVPLITWFNDTTGTFTDSINNDLAPVWISANQLTRTQCKIYLEESVGATQNARLFILLYRND